MPMIWIALKKAFKYCKSSKPAVDAQEPTRKKIWSASITQRGSKKRKKLVLPVHDPMPLELKKTITGVSPVVGKAALNSKVNHLGHRSCRSLSRMLSTGDVRPICHQCGEHLERREDEEDHHLSKHAVSELTEVDMSRKIIEKIFKTGWSSSSSTKIKEIDRILKVHNLQTTIAQFEEHRELVKIKANKFPDKHHPRCLADGNEHLRFYGTTIICLLGQSNSSSNGLCTSENCNVCNILRHGFSSNKDRDNHRRLGVLTTSSSQSAFSRIGVNAKNPHLRMALIICRAIAGRVKMTLDESLQEGRRSGFDSVALKLGPCSCLEELYLFSTRAILPCFVIIFKP